jgi:hypothetical protein
LNKFHFDVLRKLRASYDIWPQLKRWRCDQRRVEGHRVKIVMQESSSSTVAGVAGRSNARPALPPVAGAADVPAFRIGEKDIGSFVLALRTPF